MPCSICNSILKKYAVPHPNTPCPLAKGLYCSLCANYGHTSLRCKRKLQFDAIPPIKDEELHFDSPAITESMIEITDLDPVVSAALITNGLTPMNCQEKGKKVQKDFIENKKRLVAFYKARDLILVLVPPKKVNVDEQYASGLKEN